MGNGAAAAPTKTPMRGPGAEDVRHIGARWRAGGAQALRLALGLALGGCAGVGTATGTPPGGAVRHVEATFSGASSFSGSFDEVDPGAHCATLARPSGSLFPLPGHAQTSAGRISQPLIDGHVLRLDGSVTITGPGHYANLHLTVALDGAPQPVGATSLTLNANGSGTLVFTADRSAHGTLDGTLTWTCTDGSPTPS